MTKILIVEDEKHLAEGLRFNLEADGYGVACAYDGEQGLEILKEQSFDAIVLDVMMPKKNGFEVAEELRAAKDYTPILMLTALGNSDDVLKGFAAGADDYLPKPFDLAVFQARLNGLLRRREWFMRERGSDEAIVDGIVKIDGKTIDFNNLELTTGTAVVQLTLMEAKLLRYLIEHEGTAVSRKTILEDVWELHGDTDTRAIDNFIVRLRRHLETEPNNPRILQTVRGVGYRFVNEA